MKRILAALIIGLLTSLLLRLLYFNSSSNYLFQSYQGSWMLTQGLALYVLLKREGFMRSLYSITFGTSFLVFLIGVVVQYLEWPGSAFISSFALFAMMAVYLVYFLFKRTRSFLDALSLVILLSYCGRGLLSTLANTHIAKNTFQTWHTFQVILLGIGVALEVRHYSSKAKKDSANV